MLAADMTALPFPDGQADLFLSYSGLHMAVLQLLWTPFLLRYLKRDIERRTVRSQDLPDIGL